MAVVNHINQTCKQSLLMYGMEITMSLQLYEHLFCIFHLPATVHTLHIIDLDFWQNLPQLDVITISVA